MPKMINGKKLEDISKLFYKYDKEYRIKKDFINNVLMGFYIDEDSLPDHAKHLVDKYNSAGRLTALYTNIFIPSEKTMKRIMDNQNISEEDKKQMQKLYKFGEGMETAFATITKGKNTYMPTIFFTEEFFDTIAKKLNIDLNEIEAFNEESGTIVSENTKKFLEKPSNFDFFNSILSVYLHEADHLIESDLHFRKDDKYWRGVSNLVSDFRINELKMGYVFKDFFNSLKKALPSGVWLDTFTGFPKLKSLRILQKLAETIIDDGDIETTIKQLFQSGEMSPEEMEFLEQIDFEKMSNEKENLKSIIKSVRKKEKELFENIKGLDISDDTVSNVRNYARYYLEQLGKGNFMLLDYYNMAMVLRELNRLTDYIKSTDDGEGGKGKGPPVDGPIEREGYNPYDKEDELDDLFEDVDEDEHIRNSRDAQDKINGGVKDAEEELEDEVSKNVLKGKGAGNIREKIEPEYYEDFILEKIKTIINNELYQGGIYYTKRRVSKPYPVLHYPSAIAPVYARLGIPHAIPIGVNTYELVPINTEKIYFLVIDNSGSMEYENMIGKMKGAILSALECKKDDPLKVIAIDWDYDYQGAISLYTKSSNYEKNKEKFLHLSGGGGTGNFDKFFTYFDKYIEQHSDLQEALEELDLTPEEVIEKWKEGRISNIIMTDAEIDNFGQNILNRKEVIDILHNAVSKAEIPFYFIVPSNSVELLVSRLNILKKIDPRLYRIETIGNFEKLKK